MTTSNPTPTSAKKFYTERRLQNLFWAGVVLLFASALALSFQLPQWFSGEAKLFDIIIRATFFILVVALGSIAIFIHRQQPRLASWLIILETFALSAFGVALGGQSPILVSITSLSGTLVAVWLIAYPKDYPGIAIAQLVATLSYFGSAQLAQTALTPTPALANTPVLSVTISLGIIIILVIGRFLPDRLNFRLGYSILFVSVVPVLLILLVNQVSIQTREFELERNQLEALLLRKSQELNSRLDNIARLLLISVNPVEEASIAAILNGQIEDQATINQVLANQRTTLNAIQSRTDVFQELFIVNQAGRVVISTDGSQTNRDYSTAPFFITTVARALVDTLHPRYIYIQPATLDENFQPITLDPNPSRLFLLIARPILDSERNLTGLLVGRVQLSSLVSSLSNTTGLGETGESYLVSRTGTLLSDLRFAELPLGTSFNSQIIDLVRSGSRDGTVEYPNYVNEQVLAAYSYLPDFDAVLVVERSVAEISVPRQQLFATSVIVAFIALLLAGAIGTSATQIITAPITQLTQFAVTAAQGNLTATADEATSTQEFNLLARSFNTMTRQLRQLLESLEQQVADRTRALEIATEVGRELSSARDLQTLMESAVTLIAERYHLYHTQIYLADPSERVLILRAGTGEAGRELLARNHRLPIGPGSLNGRAAAGRTTVVVPDTQTSATFFKNPLLPDTRSEMAVPLVAGGRLLGVLDMQSAAPNALNDDNISAFEVLAGTLATAIENANLFTEQQKVQQQAEARAQNITRAGWADYLDAIHRQERLGFAYDLNTVVPLDTPIVTNAPHALTTAITVGDVPVGVIQLQDEENRVWQPEETELVTAVAQQVARQIDALRLIEQAQQFRREAEQALRRATREGWEAYLTDTEKKALGYAYQGAEVKPVQTPEEASSDEGTPVQPLLVGGQIIGKIGVQTHELNEDDADLIASVSTQLSAHLENLRLAEQREIALAATQRQAERLAELQEFGVQLSGLTDDLSAVYEAVIDASRNLLNADDAELWLLAPDNPNEIELVHARRADGKDLTGRQATFGQGAAGLAYQQGQTLNITDYSEWANRHLGFSDVQMNAVLAVPLISRGASIGVLVMANTLKRQSFDSDDTQIAELLAGQSASAIERARLAQQREQALSEVQRLFEVVTRLNQARDYATLANAIATDDIVGEKARVLLLSTSNDANGVPQNMQLLASHDYDNEAQYPLNFVFDLNQLTLAELWRYTGEVVDLPDMLADPRVDELTRGFVAQSKNRAAAIIPLRLGQTINGVIIINWDEVRQPASEAQLRLYRALSGQVAVALNALQLLERTRERARREKLLREISNELSNAVDVDGVLRVAARQIGQVLGRRTVVTLGQPTTVNHLESATQPANGGRGA